jgi:hypothetical protein
MATVDLVASQVMAAAASLMNDTARTVYTYTVQIPYLRIAMNELQERYQLNAIPATQKSSVVIPVDAGETEITFNAVGSPALPDDLIEPERLWERNRNINPFVPMTKVEYLPHDMEGVPTNNFVWYVWQDQKIILLESTQDNDIKIDYIKTLFPELVDENSQINVINARTFLEYRTAGLLAEFIERNLTSSESMNAYAMLALDRALGIGAHGKQAIQTRRRPFRSGWKRLVMGR